MVYVFREGVDAVGRSLLDPDPHEYRAFSGRIINCITRWERAAFIKGLGDMERIWWVNVGSLYLGVMKSEGRLLRGDCRTSVQSTIGVDNRPLQLVLDIPRGVPITDCCRN